MSMGFPQFPAHQALAPNSWPVLATGCAATADFSPGTEPGPIFPPSTDENDPASLIRNTCLSRKAHSPPAQSPTPSQRRFLRALKLHGDGNLDEAERLLERLVRKEPRNFGALHLLGVISIQRQEFERGAELITRSISLFPNDAFAHRNLGIALICMKRFEPSLASLDRAIALEPPLADAHYNRGVALSALRRFDEALASYDRAIALDANYVEAHENRGLALNELMRPEKALASLDRAVALRPQMASAHYNRGIVLNELMRYGDAVASYDRAIALRPEFADAHWNKSLSLLLRGDWENGWRLYEWRKKAPEYVVSRTHIRPDWTGDAKIKGATLFVHSEQGLGDTIQFCRYALLAEAAGVKVILATQGTL